jgi:hypothetical protein
MTHIEVTGPPIQMIFEVWGGSPERCLAIVPGQHDARLAGWLARELVNSLEKWESFEALKSKVGTACPTVEVVK